MYRLYCARNTYAMSAHILLEELAVEYELCEVELFAQDYAVDFLEASPHGRLPALRHQTGTIFESGAIAQYLTETHQDRGFGVSPDSPLRATYLQWMYYLSSTVQPEVLIQFHPENYFDEPENQQQLKTASMRRLSKIWTVLDHTYRNGPWLIDGRPTAIDYCLAVQIQWPQCFNHDISEYPNLQRLLETISVRPAYSKVMAWHNSLV